MIMPLQLGDRIDCAGHKGTVRYFGAVEGTAGQWVGVDWDDISRGKHDGTLRGVQYFKARASTSGSFVRPESVTNGKGLIEEIKRRYLESDDEETTQHLFQGKVCEFVNMGKVRNKQTDIYNLEIIVLTQMCVSHLEPNTSKCFERCVELNLSGNLLTKWSCVVDILKLFPAVRSLNLWDNRLKSLEGLEINTLSVKAPILQLVLNGCSLSEHTVACFLVMEDVLVVG
jgi:hypothetical protein